jgi:hypothetical protein
MTHNEFCDYLCDRTNIKLNKFYDYVEKHTTEKWHNRRLGYTIDLLYPYIIKIFELKDECIILDVGDYKYVFTDALINVLGCKVLNTIGDLRYPNSINKQKADIVLLMEVIEHLPDIDVNGSNSVDGSSSEVFTYSGMNSLLSNVYSYMTNESILLITTPNISSYRCIHNILKNRHPYNWQPHPKELTVPEVKELCKNNGFNIIECFTKRSWLWASDEEINEIKNLFKKFKSSLEDRDDNIFVICKK